MQRRKRTGDHAQLAFFSQMHHQRALLPARRRKGVSQRRAAVAHAPALKALRRVQMAQRHVVKGGKHLRVHVVKPADGHLLRLAASRTGHILMRQQHVARLRIDVHLRDGGSHRLRIALDVLTPERRAHMRGLHERQQVNVHRAVFVVKGHAPGLPVIYGRNIHAAPVHQTAAERDALRAVVIARDHHHGAALRAHAGQKVIQQRHGLRGRHRSIVQVARDERHVGLAGHVKRLSQHRALLLDHGALVDALAQVQVGQMKDIHALASVKRMFFHYTRFSPRRQSRLDSGPA